MVGKTNLVSLPSSIHYKVWGREGVSLPSHLHKNIISILLCMCVTIVEVEQEATHVFVIDLPSAISLILGDYLQGGERKTINTENKTIIFHRLVHYTQVKHKHHPERQGRVSPPHSTQR